MEMIWVLRIFFAVVLGSMLWVTTWASSQVSLFAIPRSVGAHPWFIATLLDAYWGFFTFYLWLAYKEVTWLSRMLWFVAVVLLGNIAMACYCLVQLCRVPTNTKIEQILLRRDPAAAWIPASMIVLAGTVAWVAS